MDDTQQSKVSDASTTRKRRSSILKSQKRTPFTELEARGTMITSSDSAKSRRVSFSRRTGVAEYVKNEATTSWKSFYEEHNLSLESSGSVTAANPPRPPRKNIGKRIFDEQFQEVEAIDLRSIIDSNTRNINTSMNNVYYAQQLSSLECTEENSIPQRNFEMSAFTDHQSKFADDLSAPSIGEMSGRIPMNFSDVQIILDSKDDLDEIEKDLERAQSTVVCPGPFTGRKNTFEYIEVDLNATRDTVRNDDVDVSIKDTIHSPKVQDVSKNCSSSILGKKASFSKDCIAGEENIALNPYVTPTEATKSAINDEHDKILVFDGKRLTVQTNREAKKILMAEQNDFQTAPKKAKPHKRKTIVLNVNDDLPNFVDNPLSSSTAILGSARFRHGVICDDDISITDPLVSSVSTMAEKNVSLLNEDEIGNAYLTQDVMAGENEKRKTIVDNCDISMTQALIGNVILPAKNVKRRTIVDNCDISMTQALPSNVILPAKNVKRRTIVDNCDISMTQALPSNVILPANNEKRRTIVDNFDMSMTLPAQVFGTEQNKLTPERRRTIPYENDAGDNISITEAIPANIITTEPESKNDKDCEEIIIPNENKLQLEKGKTIIFENEIACVSVNQAIPVNIVLKDKTHFEEEKSKNIIVESSTSHVSEAEVRSTNVILSVITDVADRNKTVTAEKDITDLTMTRVVPTNIMLPVDSEKNKTIVCEASSGNISVQTIPSNIIVTENNKKRNTMINNQGSTITAAPAVQENVLIVNNVVSHRSPSANGSTNILSENKTVNEVVESEKDMEQFQEVEAVEIRSTIDSNTRNINTSMNNVYFGQQLSSLECTEENSIPQRNFEMSAFTDHQSKFADDLSAPNIGEMSGRTSMNFYDMQILKSKDDLDEIKKDLERAQSSERNDDVDVSIKDTIHSPKVQDVSKNCSSSILGKKASFSKDCIAGEENIALNPYVTPTEATKSAINDEHDKILVFDGKRLTVQTNRESKKILIAEQNDFQTAPKKVKPHKRKTIVLNVNDDLPNFVDNPLSSSTAILGSARFRHGVICDDDISITDPLVSSVSTMAERNVSLLNEDEIGNAYLTQDVMAGENEKRKTIVDNCDISMNQALIGNVILPANNVKHRTIVDNCDISMTQALPSNVILPAKNVKRRTIVDNCDISMTQALPSNVILPAKNVKRRTIVDNCDISMTQALPSNVILPANNEKRRTIVDNFDMSMTLPAQVFGTEQNKLTPERRRTILYENDAGDISITQAIPANIIKTKPESKNDKDCEEIIIPNESKLQLEKGKTINGANEIADVSVNQAIPVNILLNDKTHFEEEKSKNIVIESSTSHVSEAEVRSTNVILSVITDVADRNKTVTAEKDITDLTMTRVVPTNIILPVDSEKNKTIVCEASSGNISVQTIPSNIIVTENNKKRNTIINNQGSTITAAPAVQENFLIVNNVVSHRSPSANGSTYILYENKTVNEDVDSEKDMEQFQEVEVVDFRSTIDSNNRNINTPMNNVNLAQQLASLECMSKTYTIHSPKVQDVSKNCCSSILGKKASFSKDCNAGEENIALNPYVTSKGATNSAINDEHDKTPMNNVNLAQQLASLECMSKTYTKHSPKVQDVSKNCCSSILGKKASFSKDCIAGEENIALNPYVTSKGATYSAINDEHDKTPMNNVNLAQQLASLECMSKTYTKHSPKVQDVSKNCCSSILGKKASFSKDCIAGEENIALNPYVTSKGATYSAINDEHDKTPMNNVNLAQQLASLECMSKTYTKHSPKVQDVSKNYRVQKLSMNQALIGNVILPANNVKHRTIVDNCDISMTQALPSNVILPAKNVKRRTIVDNCDISMTQALPSNVILPANNEKRRTIVDNFDMSMTLPAQVFGTEQNKLTPERRRTILYENDAGDISITQAIPANIIKTKPESKNDKDCEEIIIPNESKLQLEKGKTINGENEIADVSVNQAIPVNILLNDKTHFEEEKSKNIVIESSTSHVSEAEVRSTNVILSVITDVADRNKTVTAEKDITDLTMTRVVPTNIILPVDSEKNKTIVCEASSGNISVQTIPSNIIVTENNKKRNTIINNQGSTITAAPAVQENFLIVNNVVSHRSPSANGSTYILYENKTVNEDVDSEKDMEQFQEVEVVDFRSTIDSNNRNINTPMNNVNLAQQLASLECMSKTYTKHSPKVQDVSKNCCSSILGKKASFSKDCIAGEENIALNPYVTSKGATYSAINDEHDKTPMNNVNLAQQLASLECMSKTYTKHSPKVQDVSKNCCSSILGKKASFSKDCIAGEENIALNPYVTSKGATYSAINDEHDKTPMNNVNLAQQLASLECMSKTYTKHSPKVQDVSKNCCSSILGKKASFSKDCIAGEENIALNPYVTSKGATYSAINDEHDKTPMNNVNLAQQLASLECMSKTYTKHSPKVQDVSKNCCSSILGKKASFSKDCIAGEENIALNPYVTSKGATNSAINDEHDKTPMNNVNLAQQLASLECMSKTYTIHSPKVQDVSKNCCSSILGKKASFSKDCIAGEENIALNPYVTSKGATNSAINDEHDKTPMNNVNLAQQLASLECMSKTYTKHSPKVQDVSKNCCSSILGKKASFSKDCIAGEENIALNPYVTSKGATYSAINDEHDKTLVFDGMRLTVQTDREAEKILIAEQSDFQTAPKKAKSHKQKSIVLNVNDDLPNFVDNPLSSSTAILGSARFKHGVLCDDDDISITEPLVSSVSTMAERNVSLLNEDEIGNAYLTQDVMAGKNKKRKTIVDNCDISMTQALIGNVILPAKNVKRRTIVDNCDISMTQALPSNVILPANNEKRRTIVDNFDMSMTLPAQDFGTEHNKLTPELRRTIPYENDAGDNISITEAIPANIITTEPESKNDKDCEEIIIPNESKLQLEKGKTIIFENEIADVSVNQAILVNILVKDKTHFEEEKSKNIIVESSTSHVSEEEVRSTSVILSVITDVADRNKTVTAEKDITDLTMTRVVPTNIMLPVDSEKNKTIVCEASSGNISIQTSPSNIVVTENNKKRNTMNNNQGSTITPAPAVQENVLIVNNVVPHRSPSANGSTNILSENKTVNEVVDSEKDMEQFQEVEAVDIRSTIDSNTRNINTSMKNVNFAQQLASLECTDVDSEKEMDVSDVSDDLVEKDKTTNVSNNINVSKSLLNQADTEKIALETIAEEDKEENDIPSDISIRDKSDLSQNITIPTNATVVSEDKSQVMKDGLTSVDSLINLGDTDCDMQNDRVEEDKTLKSENDVQHSHISLGYNEEVDQAVMVDLPETNQLVCLQFQNVKVDMWSVEHCTTNSLFKESESSTNLKSDWEGNVNVVPKIDKLSFMGSSQCKWASSEVDTWAFLLLHGRVRLSVRLAHRHGNTRARVHADTPVQAVSVETYQFEGEKKNPVASLRDRFASEAMRHCVSLGCARADDVPRLLRRCAGRARLAGLWGRAMHQARLELAYEIHDDATLTLNVLNVPLRSVWKVTIKLEPVSADTSSAPCPTATDVVVSDVVSSMHVTEAEVRMAVASVPKDWGHVPKTVWEIFRYLKNKTKDDIFMKL